MRNRQDFFHYLSLPHLICYILCQKKTPLLSKEFVKVAFELILYAKAV